MGISSAMYSGVSGLNASGNAMSVIGNNISNSNTVGFKTSRTVFSDLLSSSISGSGGTSQVGRGVTTESVDNIFSQGTFQNTDSSTDLAVEGDGFFVLSQPSDGSRYYTRDGSFSFDSDGYLTSASGLRVQGQAYDSNGNLLGGAPSDIRVQSGSLVPGSTTSTITLTNNLDSGSTALATAPADINPADQSTYNFATGVQTYDTLGNAHTLTTYFAKDSGANNTWDWTVYDEGGNMVTDSASNGNSPLTYDSSGNLTGGSPATIPATTWSTGATNPQMTLNFSSTQYASTSQGISQNQNGYAPGTLSKTSIDSDGNVIATYSNGQQEKVASVALASFSNPEGLSKAGGNLYTQTTESGGAQTGVSGPQHGTIFTNSLEQSNVDLGTEFVNMITFERGYQANSKVITTVDQMMQSLLSLKQ